MKQHHVSEGTRARFGGMGQIFSGVIAGVSGVNRAAAVVTTIRIPGALLLVSHLAQKCIDPKHTCL